MKGPAGVGDDAEVEGALRVKHQDIGALLGGAAIDGFVLMKAGETSGALPGGLRQVAVDRDLLLHTRNRDGRRRRDRRGRGLLQGKKKKECSNHHAASKNISKMIAYLPRPC